MKSHPLLKFGSFGEAVKLLQQALNFWEQSLLPALAVDGAFGSKTDGKVREYQRSSKLNADGQVGPITWAELEPLIQKAIAAITRPGNFDAAVERIRMAANVAHAAFGWAGGGVTPNPASPKVAAAYPQVPFNPGPTMLGKRKFPRQGGLQLQSICAVAGAPAQKLAVAPTISERAVLAWQESSPEAREIRNKEDIGAWCGIFAYYVYRCAGIDLGGWANHGQNIFNKNKIIQVSDVMKVRPGYIGVLDGINAYGKNHHFVVMDVNSDGSVDSIDGNLSDPNTYERKMSASVIAKRHYPVDYLRGEKAYFFYPNLG